MGSSKPTPSYFSIRECRKLDAPVQTASPSRHRRRGAEWRKKRGIVKTHALLLSSRECRKLDAPVQTASPSVDNQSVAAAYRSYYGS
jgi:hypothetical protein